ncbi:MAG: prealbumin-like fold domain-containing protein [Eubacteriales bacterium]
MSGDEFYYNSHGSVTLPIGTITIQETKAPEGYLLNPEIFIRQITSDGLSEGVNTYNRRDSQKLL